MDMEKIVNAEVEKQEEGKTEAGKEATVVSDDIQVRKFTSDESNPENLAEIEEPVPELPLVDEHKDDVVDETDHSSSKDKDFKEEATNVTDVKELSLDTKGAEDVEDSVVDVTVPVGAEDIENSKGKETSGDDSKVEVESGDQEQEVVHSNGNGNVGNGLGDGEDEERVDNGLQTANVEKVDNGHSTADTAEEEKAIDNGHNTTDTEEEKVVDNRHDLKEEQVVDNSGESEEKQVSDNAEGAVENGLNRAQSHELVFNGLDETDAEAAAVETGLQNGHNKPQEAEVDDVEEKPVIEADKDETEQLTNDGVPRDSLDKDKVDKGIPVSCFLISRAKTGVKNFSSWCLQLDNDNFDFHSWASGFALGTVLVCSAVVVSNKYYASSR